MNLKSLTALAVCIASVAAIAATSTPKGFTDDLDAALAEAKKSGKYVYACFSGSDWCGWCKKLDKEVFSDTEFDFIGTLSKDYLFVYIDSPNDKELLSEAAKKRNPELVKKYKIRGFPSALILNGDGEMVEKTGYRRGGGKAYADFLLEVRKNGPKLIEQQKREKEINAKYFDEPRKKAESILKGLGREPKPEDLIKAADGIEAIANELKALTFDEADKEFAEKERKEFVEGCTRLAPVLRRHAENVGKPKADKPKAEKGKGKKVVVKKTAKKDDEKKDK